MKTAEITDYRVQRTCSALAHAMLDLLQERTVMHITVGEICEKAGVRRATFYKHFSDKYDLFDYISESTIKAFTKDTSAYNPETPVFVSLIANALKYVNEKPEAVRYLFAEGNNRLRSSLAEELYACLLKEVTAITNAGAGLRCSPSLIARSMVGILMYLTEAAVVNGEKVTMEDLCVIMDFQRWSKQYGKKK